MKSEKVAMVKLGYKLNYFEIPNIRKLWTYLTHTVHHTQKIPKGVPYKINHLKKIKTILEGEEITTLKIFQWKYHFVDQTIRVWINKMLIKTNIT